MVDKDGCLSYPADAEGDQISDFSFAGFQYGEIPIPDIEMVVTVGVPTSDVFSGISFDEEEHSILLQTVNQVAAGILVAFQRTRHQSNFNKKEEGSYRGEKANVWYKVVMLFKL